jgi:hypothetical protein
VNGRSGSLQYDFRNMANLPDPDATGEAAGRAKLPLAS